MSAALIADKLRASLLQAAIQGKLTKQLAEDGDARDLLKAIEAEKARLIEEKIIKKEKPLPPITDEEIPFEIPENWVWVRLGDIALYIQRGKSPKYSLVQKYPVISQKCVQWSGFDISVAKYIEPESLDSYADERLLQHNDLLWNSTGAGTVGRVSRYQSHLNPYNIAVADSHVSVIRFYSELMDSRYIESFISSAHIQQDIENMCSGTTKQKELNLSTIKLLLIPLPPLAEQHRIVEAIETALAKIDKLKTDETKLYEIQKAFPNKLRASLLQSAIQGQLTEQLAEDGNARDLLKAIEAEKARLIEEKIIKKEKPLPPITEEEIPFEIPENWDWVRLGDVALYIQRGKSPKYSLIQKYPVISQKCVQWSGFDISVAKFIEPQSLDSYTEERLLKNNDLLWNSTGTGTVGRISRYQKHLNPYDVAVADSHVSVIRFYPKLMDPLYIEWFIASAHIQQDIENMCSGTTKQKELNLSTIKLLLIPLPPLVEQQRIVEKLDEILGKVDGLKKITG